jgi:carbon monoxide dehydrogenase subunit G
MVDINREYTFDAPIDRVWALLMDTTALAECIPGCDSLEPDGENENRFAVKLTVKMAAVMGQYTGSVTLVDLAPPHSYRLLAEGRGRPGFVKGDAGITLAGADGTTEVTVEGSAQAGGAIARVGQRLIGSAACFMIDGFFKRMKAVAEGAAVADAESPDCDPVAS